MEKIKWLLIFCIFWSSLKAAATESETAFLRIEIDDSLATAKDLGELTVFYGDFYSLQYKLPSAGVEKSIMVKDREVIDLDIPLTRKYGYFKILYSSPANRGSWIRFAPIYGVNNIYLIERGDRVTIRAKENSLSFEGRGADRFRVQTEVFNIKNEVPRVKIDNSGDDFKKNIDDQLERHRIIAEKQMGILVRNRNILSEDDYRVLRKNITGDEGFMILSTLVSKFRQGWPEEEHRRHLLRQEVVRVLKAEVSRGRDIESELTEFSPYFMDYLLYREIAKYRVGHFSDEEGLGKLTDAILLRDMVKNEYPAVEDKLTLMGSAYAFSNSLSNIESFNKTALKSVQTEPYHGLLTRLVSNRELYRPAYNFSLPDSSGSIIKLSDFRGKVVIVDFWFTGCIPCRYLKKDLEELIFPYRNDELVVVTISIDKSMEYWKKGGLESGLYTGEDNINLYTEGLGWNHPIMKHYNFISVPNLLVIDKTGNLVSSGTASLKQDMERQVFTAVLEKALAQ